MTSNVASMPPPPSEATEEQLRTLWVGGLSDRVDEETLYELFVNAGPLQSVRIPLDRETKKQKPFAFVLFSHAESLPFAFELFRDVKLHGRPLRMQNKETGLGMGGGHGHGRSYNRSDSDRGQRPDEQLSVTLSQHHRSVSTPENFHQAHQPINFQQQHQQYQQYEPNIMPGSGMFNPQFIGGDQRQNPMFNGFMQQPVHMQQQAMIQQQFHQQNFPQHQFQQRDQRSYDREDQQRGASRGDRALHDRDRSRSHDRGGGDRDRRRWDSLDSHQGGGGRRDHGRSSRR